MQNNSRCSAITIKGERCKLKAISDGEMLCYRHAKLKNNGKKLTTIDNTKINPNNLKPQNLNNQKINQNAYPKINQNAYPKIDQNKYNEMAMTDEQFENYLAQMGHFDPHKNYHCVMQNQINKQNNLNNLNNLNVLDDLDDWNNLIDEHLKQNNNNNNKSSVPYDPTDMNNMKFWFDIIDKQDKTKPSTILKTNKLTLLDPSIKYECQCCYTEYSFEDLIKCSNASVEFKHLFCRDCIKGYVEANINDKKTSCQCMMDTKDENCMGYYAEDEIICCLSDEMAKKFSDMLIVSTVTSFAKMFDGYQICPFCNMYGLIIEGNIKYVKCERCINKSWCILCRREEHGDDPCWKIKNENDTDAIIYAVTETLTNALVHKCPVCHSKYIKEEGCNMMTCSSCKSYSCYLCGIKLENKKGDKYWHFYGSGGTPTKIKTCKLFNDQGSTKSLKNQGNTKFNNDKVIAECKKLLNANTPKVQIVMKNEMKKQGIDIDKNIFDDKIPNKPPVAKKPVVPNNQQVPNKPPPNQPNQPDQPDQPDKKNEWSYANCVLS